MADWRIAYSERPLGVGNHGVIEVYDDKGKLFRSFEGVAADKDGNGKAIGSERLGDIIRGHVRDPAKIRRIRADNLSEEEVRSPNALEKPHTVYVGPQAAVESAVRAMTAASKAIDEKNVPYQLPLIDSGFSAPTNSNSYLATMFAVMGLKKPPPIKGTAMGHVGAGKLLLDPDEIAGFHGMIGQPEVANVPMPPRRPSGEIDGLGKRSMNGGGSGDTASSSQPLYLRMPEMARKLYP